MSMQTRRMAAAALAVGLAAVCGAAAGEKVHSVSAGDSASSIAAKYYGDVDLGDFLLRYNGKAGTVIHAGEKLKVPYCDVHRVGKGDTWSSLATRHLGRTQAYPVVAALNGFETGDALPAGASIVIPIVLSWRLERGEALASLAERFYGDPNRADLLQMFNEVDDPRRLSVGETVRVPLVSIRLRKSAAAELPMKQPAPVRVIRGAPQEVAKSAAARESAPSPAGAQKTVSKAAVPKDSTPKAATGKTAEVPKESAPKPATDKAADVPKDTAPKPATGKTAEVPQDTAPKPATGKTAEVPQDTAPKTATGKTPESPKPDAAPPRTVEIPRPEPTVKMSPRFDKEIREAARAFEEGDYPGARRQLESLRDKVFAGGADHEKAEIARLLAYVYVAFDMSTEACAAYRSVPGLTVDGLDPDLVSPRIRDALSRCAGSGAERPPQRESASAS